jgi:hypothetical protein
MMKPSGAVKQRLIGLAKMDFVEGMLSMFLVFDVRR